MSGKRNLIIGFGSGYNVDKISLWINSIQKSGFSGVKILGSYALPTEVKRYATDHGFDVIELGPIKRSPYSDRFNDLHQILDGANFDKVISTDIADVVFTCDPSERLEKLLIDSSVLAAPEYVTFSDQDWNYDNMRRSFGDNVAGIMADKVVCNVGVLAGDQDAISNISREIYYLCSQTAHVPADQAAYNIILNSYGDEVKYATEDDAWAAQLAVHFHLPSRENLKATYRVGSDGIVRNKKRKDFCIVHQYNRDPYLTKAMKEKFQ